MSALSSLAKIRRDSSLAVEQRLLAEAVAAEHELAAARVPERDGKHAVELREALDAELDVAAQDDFAVRLRAEHVAAGLQLRTQLAVVVDLAVEDEMDLAGFVLHRLMAGRQVNDRQASHADQRLIVAIVACIVGAAMPDRVVHSMDDGVRRQHAASCRDDADDAAHHGAPGWTATSPSTSRSSAALAPR